MDLFLLISVRQAIFCWLGYLEKIICPWKESESVTDWEIDNSGCLRGFRSLVSRIAGMCYLSLTG